MPVPWIRWMKHVYTSEWNGEPPDPPACGACPMPICGAVTPGAPLPATPERCIGHRYFILHGDPSQPTSKKAWSWYCWWKNHGTIWRPKRDQESGWTRKIDGKFAEKQGQTNISRDNDDFIPINCVLSTKAYSDNVFRRCIVPIFRFQFANQKHCPWYKKCYIRKKLRWIDHWIRYKINVVKNHMNNNYNKDGFEQKTNKWQTNIKQIII